MFTDTVYTNNNTNWILAFYGYGQDATVYEPLFEKIKETHNLMVVDNPKHDYKETITPAHLQAYLQSRFDQLGIEKFSSLSFSMGSRLNLYLPILFSEQLQQIIIAAPDGIQINFWNRAAVKTPGNWFFKLFVEQGWLYMGTLRLVYLCGIINKSLYAFSKWKMRDKRQRKSVYNAWMNMRKFMPNLKELNRHIVANNIRLVSYFGKDDKVIPLNIQQKCAASFPQAEHYILDVDHDLLTSDFFDKIINKLRAK